MSRSSIRAMHSHFDIAVVGGGPAGHTAALYARRAGYAVCLIQGDQPGGQLTTTAHVENWPGDTFVGGADLMLRMGDQIEALGVTTIYDRVVVASTCHDGLHRLDLAGGIELNASAVILATGATAKWLGVDGEERLKNHGVSGCAICDGYFFKDRHVAVIGGGNSAVEEALYLSDICAHVTVIHRRDAFRAERILRDRLALKSNVDVLWNRQVQRFEGHDRLASISLGGTDGQLQSVAVDGAFVAIGHTPATAPFKDWIAQDPDGYITVRPGTTMTSRHGVFAAGDVADKVYRQAVTSAGSGCMAALDADRFIKLAGGQAHAA